MNHSREFTEIGIFKQIHILTQIQIQYMEKTK